MDTRVVTYLQSAWHPSLPVCLQGQDLEKSIANTVSILRTKKSHEECLTAIEKALSLYQKSAATGENIETLGGGWVGEEALAISLFCALQFQDDLRGGVVAAINHSGDCDSTGAITGNILGAMLGKDVIPVEWIDNLRESALVEKNAADLFVPHHENESDLDFDWSARYPE